MRALQALAFAVVAASPNRSPWPESACWLPWPIRKLPVDATDNALLAPETSDI
jgi:hypothetical protein